MFVGDSQQRRRDASTMLMVSDPVTTAPSPLDAPLPRLPGAADEARAITSQVKSAGVVSLGGAAATEAAVRSQVEARSILHFAAHTVVKDNDPFASYVALARSDGGEESDGVLTAREVYGLNLAADLVVLSACRSAGGVVSGDGVAAFARAFIYAGTASLIASVWEVADQPSNQLLPAFYQSWRGGATKAAALRRAQLQLLADLRRGSVRVTTPIGPVVVPPHPVFWAGFMLFGEPE
jgi:CHAT domain-containing protein